MRITFIGSGNVATHLALAMYGRGHVVEQIYSRNMEHAALLAARVEAKPINKLPLLTDKSNVYIIAVSDDALADVASGIRVDVALVLHTSGATPIDVLKECSTRYGVLWSPQTFVRDVALEYGELPFCIEGCDPQTEDDIAEFVGMISPHIYRAGLSQRQYLHLSAVFVNNFTNGLYAVAQQICREQNIPFEVLHPLALTTAKKLQWGDVRFQFTGPAVRNDKKTIDAHRKLLAGNADYLALYDRMTELIQKLKNG